MVLCWSLLQFYCSPLFICRFYGRYLYCTKMFAPPPHFLHAQKYLTPPSFSTILMNNTPVPRTSKYTCLGMDIDEKLTWDAHIDSICSKVSAGIGAMKRIKPFVPPATLQTIYKALIQPYFDYCSPLWDTCGKTLQDKLQKFQSRAARVITGASYDIRSTDVLDALGWQTLDVKRLENKLIMMYKILNNHTAPNLNECFCKRNTIQSNYDLRSSDTDL